MTERASKPHNYLQTISTPKNGVRLDARARDRQRQALEEMPRGEQLQLVQALRAAVDARARARQLRNPKRFLNEDHAERLREKGVQLEPGSWADRIDERKKESVRCIEALDVQAQLLIPDAATLTETRAALDLVRRNVEAGAVVRHQQFDQPAHRPDDGEFLDGCLAAMRLHRAGPKLAATVIVTIIAPMLSDGARADLLGPWKTRKVQIEHLADRLRPKRQRAS